MAVPSDKPVTLSLLRDLPKIELHAHLSGSISRQCLHEIWLRKREEGKLPSNLEDPLLAIPPGKVDYDLKTFFPLFSNYIYHLCFDASSIEYSTRRVLEDFRDDGVVYLELRTTPRTSPEHGISKESYVQLVLSTIDAFNQEQASSKQSNESPFKSSPMKTYLILSIDRRNTAAEAMEVVDLALRYQHRGVVGVDLCGDPSKGDVAIFGPAFEKADDYDLGITLHFAESESVTEKELQTLLSFDPHRIGHVIHLPEGYREEIAVRKLGLELCLSCNVHAKMITGGVENHHFGYWKNKGCPIALSTDDVGVFCSPLSNEYFLAASHFNLSFAEIVQLCKGAVEVIFGGDEEKDRLRSLYKQFS
ncbi:Metallo-dependent hydrolase [Xylona heveae TC161]|uniref:Metallo-dependent hydrolase n=1 Tax=Xylona heveae (strain CBS 132557 / TC161) TaxID=1328760 RepID=A0A165JTE3_XYLHT|nr:Metallo-dependent hydrolase [Xylona heveae TC161]KZF26601.1 Metallo-dependent hydrolase [Xylona heveae TC161]